jgi:hypothetical protein
VVVVVLLLMFGVVLVGVLGIYLEFLLGAFGCVWACVCGLWFLLVPVGSLWFLVDCQGLSSLWAYT